MLNVKLTYTILMCCTRGFKIYSMFRECRLYMYADFFYYLGKERKPIGSHSQPEQNKRIWP